MLGPEIKYRAYWKDVKQMRYFDSSRIDYVDKQWGIFIPLSESNAVKSVFMGSCEVMPFIGIHDKLGKDIYAGDIIIGQEFSTHPYSKKAKFKRFVGVVMHEVESGDFDEGNLQYAVKWSVKWEDKGKYRCSDWDDFLDCEVIGNIFENPDKISTELLAVVKKVL